VRNDIDEVRRQIHEYVTGTATPGAAQSGYLSDDDRKRFYDTVLAPLGPLWRSLDKLLPKNGQDTVYQESQSHSEYALTPTSLQFFERANQTTALTPKSAAVVASKKLRLIQPSIVRAAKPFTRVRMNSPEKN
jgi:hypothetical protein